jgi:hypothetical protein
LFVIDPGTARTMVDVKVASTLGFSPHLATGRSRVSSAVGAEEGYVVLSPRIRALGWDRESFEIACHGLGEAAEVDGLLGVDFFAGMRLTIDYGAGTVELSESHR